MYFNLSIDILRSQNPKYRTFTTVSEVMHHLLINHFRLNVYPQAFMAPNTRELGKTMK